PARVCRRDRVQPGNLQVELSSARALAGDGFGLIVCVDHKRSRFARSLGRCTKCFIVIRADYPDSRAIIPESLLFHWSADFRHENFRTVTQLECSIGSSQAMIATGGSDYS